MVFISGLLEDRLARRDEAISGITTNWGPSQQIVGPVLIVPFTYTTSVNQTKLVDNVQTVVAVDQPNDEIAYFLPKRFETEGTVAPDRLHKGIYQAVVYTANLHFTGEFAPVDLTPFKLPKTQIKWDQVTVGFPILDLRGVESSLTMKCGATDVALLPGSTLSFFPQGLHGDLPGLSSGGPIPFDLSINLHGSGSISFSPVGMDNTVHLTSPWADPDFLGSFLPNTKKVSADGFEALWHVSFYGRNFPQSWLQSGASLTSDQLNSAWYGVNFINLVDAYRNVERATKYAILFIALVFVSFFLFETMNRLRIHPIQYGLVGAALVLFYLALLSLSEFLEFGTAYTIAASASTVLITVYCAKVLQSSFRSLGMAAGLGMVYGLLYVILQLQDFSLLVGTGGLFGALASVMYVTRNINWYGLEPEQPSKQVPVPQTAEAEV
jgi:inner membrane protein